MEDKALLTAEASEAIAGPCRPTGRWDGGTMDQLGPWIGFNLFVLAMLVLDLFVFHRRPTRSG
jgi:hypothetical protein